MTAAALWRQALDAGVRFHLDAGVLRLSADAKPPADLLAKLREAKPQVIAILYGDACRTCGVALAWPRAVGLVFADGTAECMRCCDDEVERLLAAGRRAVNPALAADPAEVMLGCSEQR